MASKKLHPNVVKFKEFVKKNPQMIAKVKKGEVSWQELYEDWYLLGEEDPRWDSFKVKDSNDEPLSNPKEQKSEWMNDILSYVKNMDINQVQQHIYTISQAIGAVQGVLSQFQPPSQHSGQPKNTESQPSHPFSFRKD